jgi:parvulin-like peptidyl-prolyl isomerase
LAPGRAAALAACLSLTALPCQLPAAQVLAVVGGQTVTSTDLAQALASAPFATQFPSMDEDAQAALRGDMLVRLVNARLLCLEARALGIDKTPEYTRDLDEYRKGLLYQGYLQRLRDYVSIPSDVDVSLRKKYKGDADAIVAARAVFLAGHYEEAKNASLDELRARYHVRTYASRLARSPSPDTVVAEGDGFAVRYSDLSSPEATTSEEGMSLADRLQDRLEISLGARAAQEQGVNVGVAVEEYARSSMARLLLARKEREWVPDDTVLRTYFQAHPEIGRIPERRHIAQIVVATRAEAEALRGRIADGESFFVLAERYSIDPYGRAHAGDMGWLPEGTGMSQIEHALEGLKEGEVSDVVETPKGYHLVTLIDRLPGQQESFAAVHDRVKRAVLAEHLPQYLAQLAQRYKVDWRVPIQGDG